MNAKPVLASQGDPDQVISEVIPWDLPDCMTAILAAPWLYLNRDCLNEKDRALAWASQMIAQGNTDEFLMKTKENYRPPQIVTEEVTNNEDSSPVKEPAAPSTFVDPGASIRYSLNDVICIAANTCIAYKIDRELARKLTSGILARLKKLSLYAEEMRLPV